MPNSILTAAERTLLVELTEREVRFMVVGMSGALLQGARGATEDIDLWFDDVDDPNLGEAGGIWISGAFGMGPPQIGGAALSERFDVVTHCSGLQGFEEEYRAVRFEEVAGIRVPVLPLRRILASKRAAGRPKDRAAIPAIEDALIVAEEEGHRPRTGGHPARGLVNCPRDLDGQEDPG